MILGTTFLDKNTYLDDVGDVKILNFKRAQRLMSSSDSSEDRSDRTFLRLESSY